MKPNVHVAPDVQGCFREVAGLAASVPLGVASAADVEPAAGVAAALWYLVETQLASQPLSEQDLAAVAHFVVQVAYTSSTAVRVAIRSALLLL